MKFMENLKQKKANNKGFSLVELIIVIAIMAILVGIVGTQVIPYLNRSREAKDLQILSAYSTAAVSAYSMKAESVTGTVVVTVGASATTDDMVDGAGADAGDPIAKLVAELAGYTGTNAVNWSSDKGKALKTSGFTVTINPTAKTVTVTATGFENVVSYI